MKNNSNERITKAKARGKVIIDAAKARAKKLIDAAKARAKKLIDTAKAKPVKKTKAKRKNMISDTDAVFSALLKVTNKSSGLVQVLPVRTESGLTKKAFDTAVLALAKEGRIVIHEHDFPMSLTKAKRTELVEDERGRVYVGLAIASQPTADTKALLALARKQGSGKAVQIKALRIQSNLTTSAFDKALRSLHETGKVVLYRDDNRVTADDSAAYRINGEPRHILYVK